MKKSFLSLAVIAMMAVTTSFAQSTLVATLVHNDTITAFYGPEALQTAHANAAVGDTINLSEGTFFASNIEKGLTLRGAGMAQDTIAHTGVTTIAGDFNLNTNGSRISIEGIYSNHTIRYVGNVDNATFIRCRFKQIWPGNADGEEDRIKATFVNCRIAGEVESYARGFGPTSIEFQNCIINGAKYPTNYNWSNQSRSYMFKNCILTSKNLPSGSTTTFNNCIFVGDYGSNSFESDVNVYNCLQVSDSDFEDNGIFKNLGNATNKVATGYSNVFMTYKGEEYNDNETFELTETAQTTYLGGDDKQVGIYGGNVAFKPTLDFPQITKFEVADKTTSDGKLNITIQVKNAN